MIPQCTIKVALILSAFVSVLNCQPPSAHESITNVSRKRNDTKRSSKLKMKSNRIHFWNMLFSFSLLRFDSANVH